MNGGDGDPGRNETEGAAWIHGQSGPCRPIWLSWLAACLCIAATCGFGGAPGHAMGAQTVAGLQSARRVLVREERAAPRLPSAGSVRADRAKRQSPPQPTDSTLHGPDSNPSGVMCVGRFPAFSLRLLARGALLEAPALEPLPGSAGGRRPLIQAGS